MRLNNKRLMKAAYELEKYTMSKMTRLEHAYAEEINQIHDRLYRIFDDLGGEE